MARKKKEKTVEPQVFIDKYAVQKVVEGLTELLMGVITGNDNLTNNNKEIHTNDESNNDSTDVT